MFLQRIRLKSCLVFFALLGAISSAQENDSLQSPLKYPFTNQTGGLYLNSPIKTNVYYDVQKGLYVIERKIGDFLLGPPQYLTKREYADYALRQRIGEYYKSKSRALDEIVRAQKLGGKDKKASLEQRRRLLPSVRVKSKFFETVFGGNTIELIPKGRIGLDFGALYQWREDPRLPPRNRSSISVDINRQMQMSILGRVGKNVELKMNYDTQAGFSFENRMNLGFKGQEDDIVKKLELGNVSMPLSTSLIRGAQSLFGVKGEFQFGKTHLTAVFSQQQSQTKVIPGNADGVVRSFKKQATDYQDNQHYFLAHYFRNNYDKALERYPIVNSNFTIEQIEVWALDIGAPRPEDRRSIIAIRDLGEGSKSGPPSNEVDGLYGQLEKLPGINDVNQAQNVLKGFISRTGTTYREYEHFLVRKSARLLSSNEYSVNARLGYLSLKRRLEDRQMLAVAFRYRNNATGQVYIVGDFSADKAAPAPLTVKLLKSDRSVDVSSPMWQLMMKNIYRIASSFTSKGFTLNVYYNEPGQGGVTYLTKNGKKLPLLYLLNLDRFNQNNRIQKNPSGAIQPEGDGVFDFQEGYTVNVSQGQVIFPQKEPFGATMKKIFEENPQENAKYVFEGLYTRQKVDAGQEFGKNRYTIQGQYVGKTYLGAIAQGSARVIMEGRQLVEGVDYMIDYQTGDVQIINPSLKGKDYQLVYEEQTDMLTQQRTFAGLNVDHHFSKDFKIGATVVNYSEKPITPKVIYGNEPVNNTVFGVNSSYGGDLPFLTRWIDKIPFVETKAPSRIRATAEGAYLKPGTASGVGEQVDIDNFDRDQKRISLMSRPETWSLASAPGGGNPEFSNVDNDNLSYGYNRGLLSWYNISPLFYSQPPSNISRDEISKNLARRVERREIYTGRELSADNLSYINTFDLTFYPQERGPYNFNSGIEAPQNRWGGIMRALTTTDFDQANIQYLEFWLMDPFADNTGSEGELILQLGDVSEDILKDGYLQYENGLPYPGREEETVKTLWGRTPQKVPLLYTFETQGQERAQQDLGLDGLSDTEEAQNYQAFANSVNPVTQAPDPAADNYVYHFDSRWDGLKQGSSLVNRYKYYRNTQGNSPSNSFEAATGAPDVEDINQDYNMSRLERYYQYKLKISKADLEQASPESYVVDKKTVLVSGLPNGGSTRATWYQIRIPLEGGKAFGEIQNLKSMNYFRLLMKGFSETTTLRFAEMNLVGAGWRIYTGNVAPDDENRDIDKSRIDVGGASLAIGSVNIEQNGKGNPPYVLPPGVKREEFLNIAGSQLQNEASMSLVVRNLGGADVNNIKKARAVFRDYPEADFRLYKKLRMYVHAENLDDPTDGRLDFTTQVFIRIGNDAFNYYEYEIPVKYTPKNTFLPSDVWPTENLMEVDIQSLIDAKLARDRKNVDVNQRFKFQPNPQDSTKLIYVRGRPSVGAVGRMMIGMRNTDSNTSKNLLFWFNELKLVGISAEGGYAALGKINLTLADLASVELSGSYTSAGFGALDQRPAQRPQKTDKDYQIKTGLNLDKFFPKKWGLRMPINFDRSEKIIDPVYNPMENDVKVSQAPNSRALKEVVKDYRKVVGYNVSLSKTSTGKNIKPRPWDLENFSLVFAYRNNFSKNIYNVYSIQKDVENTLIYNFSFQPKFYKPFSKLKIVQDSSKWAKYLGWFKEFNINPWPTRLNITTKINRTYREDLLRDVQALSAQDIEASNTAFTPFFSNNFRFDWGYNIMFDPTKSLKLDFSSQTYTLVNDVGSVLGPDQSMVWKSFFKVGDPIRYRQTLDVNYQLPIRFLPYMDWVSTSSLLYRVAYQWDAKTFDMQNTLGNDIQNSQYIGFRTQLSFERLYAKIPAFVKLDEKLKKRDIELQRELARLGQAGKRKKGKSTQRRVKPSKIKFTVKDYLLMTLSSVKQAKFNYTTNNISLLNGFLPQPGFFGQGRATAYGQRTSLGPPLGFIFGSQDDIRQKAIDAGWITASDVALSSYDRSRDERWDASILIEPIKDLRIELTAYKKSYITSTYRNFNRDSDPAASGFQSNFPVLDTATLEMSFGGWNTIFNNSEALYDLLRRNANTIISRLSDGGSDGYSLTNQAVLLPAFLSAYGSMNPSKVALGYKRSVPIPNWSVTYTGLARTKWFINHVERFDLQHAYRSTYVIRGVQTNLAYVQNPGGKDQNGNFLNPMIYNSVILSSRFEPLLGLGLTLRNRFQLSAAYSKGRDINLIFATNTLVENNNEQWSLGCGYIFRDLKFRMRFRGKRKTIRSDLNLNARFKITDTQSVYRKIIENFSQESGGQRRVDLNMAADYNLSKTFQVTAFFEYMLSRYRKSIAYPMMTFSAGIKILFIFGN